jgi:hypothetical protein
MNITIIDEGKLAEPEALGRAVSHASRWHGAYTNTDHDADIYVSARSDGINSREPAGWLEYLIVLKRPDGERSMTIGMVQRSVGAEFEFHS